VEVVALIPARGGSKGIPRKNLAPLAGKPLLAWTVEAALAARAPLRVVVSTDDGEIATVAAALGAGVLVRPAELAADDAPMLDVVLHAADALGDAEALVVLQPTSPLRRAEHVDAAVALLEETGADGVVSVVEVPHNYRPGKLLSVQDGRVRALGDEPLHRDLPALYARNGPAVLALRIDGLAERGLYGGDVRAYVMDAADSVDVDSPFDLRLAELLLGPEGP
jgi:CMP-N-acetylneuraminic acid synthetase